jgi:hypothetical protein
MVALLRHSTGADRGHGHDASSQHVERDLRRRKNGAHEPTSQHVEQGSARATEVPKN